MNKNVDYCYNSFAMSNKNLDELVHRFWELESEGITNIQQHSDDDECMKKFNETTYFDNKEGRYVVQLPFKGKQEDLPNNIQLAYARLKQNIKNLRLKPGMMEKYHNIIQEQLARGIIGGVQENQLPLRCHYLPHHAVLTEEKLTTKMRCVHDASAKTKGNPSLNDLLNRGPVLLPDLTGILLRIRTVKILVFSDIEKAFLMVRLSKKSRDFTRFFWLKDPHKQITCDNVITYRFRRVPFGLVVSPFLLAGTIQYHLKMSETPLAQSILRNTYVDNIFYGVNSIEEGKEFYQQSKELFKQAGMNLRQYVSNSTKLNQFLQEQENSNVTTNNKILGISWDISKDSLCIKLPTLSDEETWTKRKISNVRKSTLLMSKTRLSPLKATLTIPRLELSAIAMGSQLLKHICDNLDLPISKTVIWSDSSVALSWIKNEKELPSFIRNRTKTIKESAPNSDLRYVPGNENPADVGSRGTTAQELISFKLWWEGPTFLSQARDQWPTDITSDPTTGTFHAEEDQTSHTPSEDVINTRRFSTWTKLYRTVYYVLLFLTKKSTRAKQHFGNNRSTLFNEAETILFRLAQKQNPPSEEVKAQLHLYHCNNSGLWKSKGRITKADMPIQTITPVFLPHNNHSGTNQTLCELRRSVWIPKGRVTVKKTLHNLCYYCRRCKAQPFSLPEFPAHPPRRVRKPDYPFENIGMDYAGPLFYRNDDNSASKYWILLITCLNTRAIYVDLVKDMTAKTLLHTLRRFFASTAYPKWILCDNAKTFKSIDELQSSYKFEDGNDPDIIDYCAQRRIEFKFIPSLSPWQGGLYEKMVHIFKVSFKHALQNRLLKFEELQTIAKETETIVNQRPLTYMTEDDHIIPLRPIDFLRPWTNLSLPRTDEHINEWRLTTQRRDHLMEEWKTMNDLLTRFWRRWSSEYLTNLREQYRVTHPRPRCINESHTKAGDIVLIQEKSLERGQWKIGRVISPTDDFQRSASVLLPSKRTRHKTNQYALQTRNR
ncbi:hypothetical protein ANCCEY_09146 [Ancylostoma ceylanicum]|uniref:Integrase catalytic domain-containing protein n=1 Tax=Ancylostoma ceylanicum TaxID=53326 RepID=A0A0D6LIB2_9BILA|nr:hypothetical protein ANCCEY_09146 [Ancylostoma ceylanicum]